MAHSRTGTSRQNHFVVKGEIVVDHQLAGMSWELQVNLSGFFSTSVSTYKATITVSWEGR